MYFSVHKFLPFVYWNLLNVEIKIKGYNYNSATILQITFKD